ncbi:MAG: anthranilate synthase component I family protein [Thermoplasmata archaeon]
MTDPWIRFSRAVGTAETAGYFERTAPSGAAGTAGWFVTAKEVRSLERSSDPAALSRDCARFLSDSPKGGVLGYVGFDAVGLFEPALARFPTGSPFPLGELAFVDAVSVARVPSHPRSPAPAARAQRPLSDSLARPGFERSVSRLVEEVRAGEAFQVVLAHRRAFRRPSDLLERAGWLRQSERFAYFYYLRFGDLEIVGGSPESVAEVRGSRAYVNPIAGTLPMGLAADRRPLLSDPKELSEHRMLVDLARNDLGRVARPGTVRVLDRERRERYARLEHLVSRVGATLRPGLGPWEVLGAAFPAGTVSGAPKIRATDLLRREEDTWRGPYAGAVGWLRPHGVADWALTIRSGFAAKDRLYTAAGAGIVHRSEPAREFDETLAKLAQVELSLVGVTG